MATLALAAVGAAVGGAVLPAGIGVLGATLSGAAIGSQIGALAGSYVDNALFGASGQTRTAEGPRLSDLRVMTSIEGAPIPRAYGRARLGGQVIWATDFDEDVITSNQAAGGGKGVGGPSGGDTELTEYRYFANFAVALCEGQITGIGRVWADGQDMDLTQVRYRLYRGTELQSPDSLIVAREGAGDVPAYRGVAYIVFERLALAPFGNRLPQLSFEVFRRVGSGEEAIRAAVVIPGSGEFVYATEPVAKVIDEGISEPENVHTRQGACDWAVGIDQLQSALPNVKAVSLVVSWFADDLRAGSCSIRPGVETAAKATDPIIWKAGGVTRPAAHLVSTRDGRPAYGGTPSDLTVLQAIRDLKARGMAVTLTPFVLMDVAEDNTLADPYGASRQAAYPWRGRITCHPAPGRPSSPDKTGAATSQIASFMGTATAGHFAIVGDDVVYSGPAEWSYRRMVLHQAFLAKAAGGVDAFLIGTELRGLTTVRSSASSYPFVAALVALAADVKAVLGAATALSYAADWTEYFGHQPADGSGDVYFHLDPLWSSPSIAAVGIDVYWPLGDWRDGRGHLDYQAGYRSAHDADYARSNVAGGEGYDWYYASQSDRRSQIRTPISDGAGKPWVYRFKDVKSWWLNAHYNRPGGIEAASPTAWVAQSKPFWFMEIGCPAVDKGSNQPNVFVDPKSAENALPYFSSGTRDDLIQRRTIQAMTGAFDWTSGGYIPGLNPVSTVTGERMVDGDRMHVYCWDARPYPAFPFQTGIWSDGANWALGHWLNGRAASSDLGALVAQILRDRGYTAFDVSALTGTVPGYVIDRIMSARDALQVLELAYFFDSIESGGKIVFRHRGAAGPVATFDSGQLVETRAGEPLSSLTRAQETDLPASAKVRFISGAGDYRQAVAEARRLTGASGRTSEADVAIVLDDGLAGGIAETWLFEAWASRERASFTLPPSALAIEPGDVISLQTGTTARPVRVTSIGGQGARSIEALSIDPDLYGRTGGADRPVKPVLPVQIGRPSLVFLDVPPLAGAASAEQGYVAAFQKPWPGSVAVYASPQTSSYGLKSHVAAPATIGRTLDPLPAGPAGRFDRAHGVRVAIRDGRLASADMLAVLGGANVAAVANDEGTWEIIQYLDAELIDVATYRLSGLLRGQAGTEDAMRAPLPAGATFVVLDAAVTPVPLQPGEINAPLNWRFGPGNRPPADAAYSVATHAFRAAGLRPLSPVHVRGLRDAGGDLMVRWVRRTRTGGDAWDSPDVPLGEESEAYEIDIMAGTTVKRTIASSTGTATYTAAQQAADFGSAQSMVSFRVFQLGAGYGRGAAAAATV